MALIQCPECHKPNVSSTAACCPECGYVFSRKDAHKKGNPYLACIFGLILIISTVVFNYEVWEFFNTLILVITLLVMFASYPGVRIHPMLRNGITLVAGLVGSARIVFDYNITRMPDFGFFESYADLIGLALGLFQIVAVIVMIMFLSHWILGVPKRRITSRWLYVAGFVGLVFYLFDIVYLSLRWGSPSLPEVYVDLGIRVLMWFCMLASATFASE